MRSALAALGLALGLALVTACDQTGSASPPAATTATAAATVTAAATAGGGSWSASVPLPDAPGFITSTAGISLRPGAVADFGGVLLVSATGQAGGTQRRYVFRSTHGGASWHAFATDYTQAAPIAPQVTFGDALTGYATVRGGLARTVDGGAHWTHLRTPGT